MHLDMKIMPLGYQCRVVVDGQDISGVVQRAVIVADMGQGTRVYLSCVKTGGEPFVIRGTLADFPLDADGMATGGLITPLEGAE